MHQLIPLVLTNEYINVSPATDAACMLSAYGCATLLQAGLSAPIVVCNEEKKNDVDESRPCLLFRADAYCTAEDLRSALQEAGDLPTRFVNHSGEILAIQLNHTPSVLHLDDFAKWSEEISCAQKLSGEVITPQNFERIFAARNAETVGRLRLCGVWIEAEKEVVVSPFYKVGEGTFLGKGTRLYGSGSIGTNCVLQQNCHLTDTDIGNSSTLMGVVAEGAKIGNDTRIGPYSYLRPGSVIGDKVKIGDFVEVKNSSIGDKTSVAHLTYIGDCEVGRNVNFGCGTVISNYDGQKKYRTSIGDCAFIGCNTNLIAPVSVGDNAYIAAGSTITDDVPDTAFAIARQRQTTKPEWVRKNKPELIGKERC